MLILLGKRTWRNEELESKRRGEEREKKDKNGDGDLRIETPFFLGFFLSTYCQVDESKHGFANLH